MKKIDAHMHLNLNGLNAEKMIRYLDKNQIEKCWLLTWEESHPIVPELYQALPVEEVFEAYTRYPDRIVPFYAPDPHSESFSEHLKQYKQLGFKGCGELKVSCLWGDAVLEPYLKTVSALGFPIVFHMEASRMYYHKQGNALHKKALQSLMNGRYNGIPAYYIASLTRKIKGIKNALDRNSVFFPGYLYDFIHLEERLVQFPGINFIAHGPHFWNHIAQRVSDKYVHQKGKIKRFGIVDGLLTKHANLYCDLSGVSGYNALNRDKKQARVFLEKHADRILFGTDNWDLGLESLLKSLHLSDQTLSKICFKNAEKLTT